MAAKEKILITLNHSVEAARVLLREKNKPLGVAQNRYTFRHTVPMVTRQDQEIDGARPQRRPMS